MTTLRNSIWRGLLLPFFLGIASAEPLADLVLNPGGDPVVSWPHTIDKSYTLETSDDLSVWLSEESLPQVTADGAVYNQTVLAEMSSRKFFRLRERALDQFAVSATPNPDGSPQIITTIAGGQLRRYFLFLPSSYTAAAPADRTCDNGYALAIICHGSGQTAASFISQHPALISKCDLEDVILVLPQGTWNAEAGKYSFNSLDDNGRRDDVSFVVNIAADLRESLWVDRTRVYIGGFSNGGIFSQLAVARSPGTFAAFTAIGSALGGQAGGDANSPIIRIPMPIDRSSAPALIVNGRADTARPWNGGPSNGDGPIQPAVIEMPLFWHEALRCPDPFTITNILGPGGGGNLAGKIESACAGTQQEIAFVDLINMDHIWPDAADNVGWDANREVIDFFLAHQRVAIEDDVSPDPIVAPAHWVRTTFENSDVVYSIPPAPAAIVFVAGDVDQIEMIDLLEGLAVEGIAFFAVDGEDPTLVQNLHAELVATTEITEETRIVMLGFGEGGQFAMSAAESLDSETFKVGGVALLATPIDDALGTALQETEFQVYFSHGENDTTAPPLPSWLAYREISVYSMERKQQSLTDFYPALSRRLTTDRLTRVPGITTAEAGAIITELINNNVIDIDGSLLLCPDSLDCETLPLPAGFTADEESQLRLQLCAAFAGHAPNGTSLPSLRRFCIGARRLLDPPPAPIPTTASDDSSPTAPVPTIPWTITNNFGGFPVRAYIPAAPVALAFFFHGTSANIDFYDRVEQREMIHALFDADIGVVCTLSTDRDNLKSPAAQWDTRSLHPDTRELFTENEDWVRVMGVRDQLIANTAVASDTPLFSMGFSNGGGFALTFAHLAQQTGLVFSGAAVHAQAAADEDMFYSCRRLTPGTPIFLTVLANDNQAAKMPVLADMLTALGHDVTFEIAEEVRLQPERFERIPGVTVADAQMTFNSLVNNGVIDATGLRQIEITDPVPGLNADEKRQLSSTIFVDHSFSARKIAEEMAWFEAQLP